MNIFISYDDNKFINNLILTRIYGVNINSGIHKNQLYRIHHNYKNHVYIFTTSSIDKECLQFIEDYGSKTNIFIYHESLDTDIVQKLGSCFHLIHDSSTQANNIIQIPNLINKNIFYNKNLDRLDSVVTFIDNLKALPDNLNDILYPNTKWKIKMYGSKIKHNQNIGYITEIDKAEILNKNQHYLSIDNYYENEANACGCKIYTIDSIKECKPINSELLSTKELTLYSDFLISLVTK